MIGKALVAILEASPELATKIGKRIFPLFVPQSKEYPAITYQIISDVPRPTLYTTSGMDKIRVQINVFSASYSDLEAISAVIRQVLDGYKGYPGPIAHIWYEVERDDPYAQEALIYQRAIDYFIQFRRQSNG